MKHFFSCIVFFSVALLLVGCSSAKQEESVQDLIRTGKVGDAAARFQLQYDINEADADGNTPLHVAAEKGETDLITRFVLVGANTELKNYNGDTPLHVAIKTGNIEAAKILSAIGGNLFARDGNGTTAIDMGFATNEIYYDIFITAKSGEIRDANGQSIVHYFVRTGNEKAIAQCVKKNIPLSVMDNDGKMPLDIAFDTMEENKNSVYIAAELIKGGAELVTSDYQYFQTAVLYRNMDNRTDDGQTPLHESAIGGHTNVARYLLENSARTDMQDIAGTTALHEAVRYGRLKIAQMLLAQGASVNAEDNLGKTPAMLIMPVDVRDELYDLLISYKADLRHKDMFGDTVLHTAEMAAYPTSTIDKLVHGGALINERNKEGSSPLVLAIEHCNSEHVAYYAENGADIHSSDKNGVTPLELGFGASDEIFESLVYSGNIMSRDSNGNTPLHIAIIENAPIPKTQYLMSLMADVNTRNSSGDSALYLAVQENKRQIGELLLAKNADIFSVNTQNSSPLRLALQAGEPIMSWFINSQTIRATDGSGNTPLHYAAEWGMTDSVIALLKKGASTDAANASGETAIFSAVKSDNEKLLNYMAIGGCSIFARDNMGSTPLHHAVRWNASNAAEYLVANGLDINAQNLSGKSALAESVMGSNIAMANMLLTNGADVNVSDNSGRTILMDAIKANSPETVALLINHGANPQIQEINGRNAYHEAAAIGNVETIALIRKAGGNPLSRDKNGVTPFALVLDKNAKTILAVLGNDKTAVDSDGNTPAHIAVKANAQPRVIELLAKNNFPIDARNASGATPLSIAVASGKKNAVSVLLENGANPFITIDKYGTNATTIALSNNDKGILAEMAKYAGNKSDTQGNTLLHYAARMSSPATIGTLLAYGLDMRVKNIAGETPYDTAIRWKRDDAAGALQLANK